MTPEWHSIAVRGVTLLDQGDRVEARALLKRAVALHPTEAWPYIKLAEVLEESDLKVHLYERSLEVEVTDWAFVGLIDAHLKNGRLEAAHRAFTRANAALSDMTLVTRLCPRIFQIDAVFNDPSFNWQEYLKARPRLSTKERNPADVAIQHYLEVGRFVGQKSQTIIDLPGGFNFELYRILHPATHELGEDETYAHFVANEPHDAALYSMDIIPRDFDPSIYQMLNPDLVNLSGRESVAHYLTIGKSEKRLYNTGLSPKEMRLLSDIDVKPYEHYRNNCVVFINHDSSLTGAPLFLKALSEYLATRSIFQNVLFLDTYVNPAFSALEKNDRVVRLYYNNDVERLREMIAYFNPLLIYSNSLNVFLKSVETFLFVRYRAIFHLHESISDARVFRDLTTLQEDRVYAVSDRINNDLSGLGLRNVKTFPPFLAPETFAKLDASESAGRAEEKDVLSPSAVTIGMCGPISERKNFELFQYLSRKRPDLSFVWIGGKPDEVEAYSTKNLSIVPFTANPYEHFQKMDYFFLTSRRDPCPIVVLEALYLNKKVLVLDKNISYEHPQEKLESYLVIEDHKNDPETILAKFNSLPLTKSPNATRRNQDYIREEFSQPRLLLKKPCKERDVVALSYYVAPTDSLDHRIYYSNLINQFLLRNDHECEVVIQFASNAPVKEEVKRHFAESIQAPLRTYERSNRGFDIGGLMASVKRLFDETPDRDGYLIYLHTKSNEIWREPLHRVMFCDQYRQYDTIAPEQFTVECKLDDLNRPTFGKYSLFNDVEKLTTPFTFVAGTTFITKFRNVVPLYRHHDEIDALLTDINTDDRYWREIMLNEEIFERYYEHYLTTKISSPIDIDGPSFIRDKGCKNYFELLSRYNKRGIPDCQFEHALERLIGHMILDGKRVRMV